MQFRQNALAAALTLTLTTAAGQDASSYPLLRPLLPPPAQETTSVRLEKKSKIRRGYVHVTLSKGETARDAALAYGVDPAKLRLDLDREQPAGAVVRVPLAVHTEGRLPPGVVRYVVRSGDTLSGIAARHGLSVPDLISTNLDRESLDRLAIGDRILIPTVHVGLLVRVKEGQDVVSLASYYGANLGQVAVANALSSPTELREGDYLLLPGVRAEGRMQQLIARRERERENELKRQRLAQYQRYLAWQKSEERRKLKERYERQARYEAWVAQREEQRRREQASAARQRAVQQAASAARAHRDATQNSAARSNLPAAWQTAFARADSVVNRANFGSDGIQWPMRNFRLTSRFGERDIGVHRRHFHGGVDFAAPYGTPVYAASSGSVQQSGWGAYGVNVWMRSGNATVIYGHLSRTAVNAGQFVQAGQLVGYVGCTGICTGPHLHFETRIDGVPVDPLRLLP